MLKCISIYRMSLPLVGWYIPVMRWDVHRYSHWHVSTFLLLYFLIDNSTTFFMVYSCNYLPNSSIYTDLTFLLYRHVATAYYSIYNIPTNNRLTVLHSTSFPLHSHFIPTSFPLYSHFIPTSFPQLNDLWITIHLFCPWSISQNLTEKLW